ncbi:MAG: hypothetical protein FWE82_07640 [Defluviitaleaceae bacterium]|nr:hypothetical protein [Defluviitaleaceae bacterium]
MDKHEKENVFEILNAVTQKKIGRCRTCIRVFIGLFIVLNIFFAPLVATASPAFFALLFLPMMVFFYTAVVFIIIWLIRYRPLQKSALKILRENGKHCFDGLIAETKNITNIKLPHLGEDYFLYVSCGLLLKYDEIAWLYLKVVETHLYYATVRSDTHLMLATVYGKAKSVALTREDAAKIETKNPNLMVGFSPQNQLKYREIVNMYSRKK